MGKVFAIHEWELRPGVSEAEFLQTVRDVFAQPHFPKWQYSLLKGNRGPRTGMYALLIEVEDVATRDRYTVSTGLPLNGVKPKVSCSASRSDVIKAFGFGKNNALLSVDLSVMAVYGVF